LAYPVILDGFVVVDLADLWKNYPFLIRPLQTLKIGADNAFNEITKLKANNLKGHIKFVCVRILVGKCGTNTRVGTYFKFVGCGEHSEPHQSSNANGAVRSSPHPTALHGRRR